MPHLLALKSGGAVAPHRGGEQVLVVVIVIHTSHEGEHCPVVAASSHDGVGEPVVKLVVGIAEKTLHAGAHIVVDIILRTGADHRVERMLVGQGVEIGEGVVPQVGETLIGGFVQRGLRLWYWLPVVLGTEAVVIPELEIDASERLEGELIGQFDLRVEVTQHIVAVGFALAEGGGANGVADVAVLVGGSPPGPAAVVVIDRLCGQCGHGGADIVCSLLLHIVTQGEVMTKADPWAHLRLAVELYRVAAVGGI